MEFQYIYFVIFLKSYLYLHFVFEIKWQAVLNVSNIRVTSKHNEMILHNNHTDLFNFDFHFRTDKMTSCYCPKTEYAGTKADTAFQLSNGKTIVLCGYKNPESKPATFSEFILSVCGEDTIIDFWDAVLTCRLKVNKDTLLVDELQNLPTGRNFKYQETVWTTERIYFRGSKVVRKLVVNRQIRKYSQAEIQTVLKTYENAKQGLDDNKMVIANQLFIATISGDKRAGQYFKEFNNKFGTLDGAFKEEYSDLTAMLKLWDRKE